MQRRSFLTTSLCSSIGLSSLAHSQESAPEKASSSSIISRTPHVYKFQIGKVEAWSISDAYFMIRSGVGLMWPEEDRPTMKTLLETERRKPEEGIPLYANVLVIKDERETLIFDSGFGGKESDNRGWLLSGLALAGIAPESVTGAFLSHAHSDHLNGFVRDEKAVFPNAEIHLLQSELDFWQNPEPDFSQSKRDKKQLPRMIKSARKHFDILTQNLKAHSGKTSLFDGLVTIEPAPGHTSGHAAFRIRSDGEEFLHLMDLAHHDLLMFADPNWTIGFDHHPKQAVVTRKAFWEEAATKGTRCFGFHLPFPGIGYIIKAQQGYRWSAEPWQR